MRYILDLETDGLLKECTKVHCASIRDVDSDYEKLLIDEAELTRNIQHLIDTKDEVIGHNIFGFDNEVIRKLYKIDLSNTNKVQDTFIMSQVLFGDLKHQDFTRFKDKVPNKLIGSHSLAAWGFRLDCHKGEYTGGFEAYNDDMGIYCSQDTLTTKVLLQFLESQITERTWK
jgi:DNA polymerase I